MENTSFIEYFMALMVVILLILGVFWMLARGNLLSTNMFKPRHRKDKRLQILEIMPIDTRRKIIIVSKDDREITLLLGPNGDVVIDPTNTFHNPSSDHDNSNFNKILNNLENKEEDAS